MTQRKTPAKAAKKPQAPERASTAGASRLPEEDSDRPGLRRGGGVAAGTCEESEPAPEEPGLAQARRPAAGAQLQTARRLQQDGASLQRAAEKGRDLRLGRQPCSGGGAGCQQAGHAGRDRDANDHAAGQDRCGARAGRRGRSAWRKLFRCLRPCGAAAEKAGADLCAPVRRPRCDRRPGHDRHGNAAPAAKPGLRPPGRGVRGHWWRRPDFGCGQLHQGGAPRDQGDWRADERLGRDDAVGRRW